MSFRLVPNSVTLDDLEGRNIPNRRFRGRLHKSGSLSSPNEFLVFFLCYCRCYYCLIIFFVNSEEHTS